MLANQAFPAGPTAQRDRPHKGTDRTKGPTAQRVRPHKGTGQFSSDGAGAKGQVNSRGTKNAGREKSGQSNGVRAKFVSRGSESANACGSHQSAVGVFL